MVPVEAVLACCRESVGEVGPRADRVLSQSDEQTVYQQRRCKRVMTDLRYSRYTVHLRRAALKEA